MRYAQDLVATAQRAQALPHPVGSAPADSGVDFIEDERLARGVGPDGLEPR